jgi:hypothetical protein
MKTAILIAVLISTTSSAYAGEVEYKAHPGDKGRYFILEKTKLGNGDVRMLIKRVGPLDTTFSLREFKCPGGEGSLHRYVAEGDRIEDLKTNAAAKAKNGANNWSPTSYGSSTFYAHVVACK